MQITICVQMAHFSTCILLLMINDDIHISSLTALAYLPPTVLAVVGCESGRCAPGRFYKGYITIKIHICRLVLFKSVLRRPI